MNRYASLIVMLLVSIVAMGQSNVTIRGTVADGAGKKVLLGGYSDMLTQSETLLDSTLVAADGSFSLACYANYPRLVFVQIECYSQSFYIEPGRTYEVYVPTFDWDLSERHNVFLDPVALPLEFMNMDSSELNLRIMRYEEMVDSLIAANRERLDFRFHPDRRLFARIQDQVWKRFRRPEEEGTFFDRYVEYNMLEMALAMRMVSRQRVATKYIINDPIRYYDESYMRLFISVFDHAITNGTKRLAQWKMADWVSKGDLAGWLDSLGLDPLLQNEQVRELAALVALREMYYDKYYDRRGVRLTTERLRDATKFEEHRLLADRLLMSFAERQQGVAMKTFTLPDADRRQVSLDEFRGRWVYLGFVRVNDPHSQKEIETMAYFRDTVYKTWPDVVFVTVACDREFQKMYHFLKNSKRGCRYRWTWLHFDGDYRMLERFGVTSYPTFILLDPEGRQVYDYTPPPASGILLRGPWQKQ